MEKKRTLISILNYNGSEDTKACVDSFLKHEDKEEYTLVIWDNASKEEQKNILKESITAFDANSIICSSEEYLSIDTKAYDIIVVLSNDNLGFSAGNNAVMRSKIERYDYAILLNNDTEFVENTTKHLIEFMDSRKDVGVSTTAIYYYYNKDAIWNAGGKASFGTRKYYTENYVQQLITEGKKTIEVDFVTGCYLVMRCDVLKETGLLTEKFFFGEEDYEFCMRLRKKNIRMEVLLQEKMYHKVGASIKRNQDNIGINRRAFVHHLNRFIDMRDYYSGIQWNVWRWCSSLYIFLLMAKKSDFKWAWNYIIQLNKHAVKCNGVSKELFLKIVNGEII